MDELIFDARQMEHPEPLERILAMLPEIAEGGSIRMIHRREPFPLYEILAKRGFSRKTIEHSPTHFEILIQGPEGKERVSPESVPKGSCE